MTVPDEVVAAWDARLREVEKPPMGMLLRPREDRAEALAAVDAAIADAMQAFEQQFGPDADEFEGGWVVGEAPEGVMLRVDGGCDVFEWVLGLTVAGVASRGVDGTLEVYEPDVPPPPEVVDLLECRLRVAGRRCRLSSGQSWLAADPESLWQTLLAAYRWVTEMDGDAVPLLWVSDLPGVALLPAEDVERMLRGAVGRDRVQCELTWVTPERVRSVAVEASRGRVSLVEGGAFIGAGEWPRPRDRFVSFLGDTAEWTVYGFVKRGSNSSTARLGWSLTHDWPSSRDYPAHDSSTWPVEDSHAPDAFGVQLLAPALAERLVLTAEWRHTELVDGRVLLEHCDQRAWFDQRFTAMGGNFAHPRYDGTVPEILARARRDLQPILFTREIQADFADPSRHADEPPCKP